MARVKQLLLIIAVVALVGCVGSKKQQGRGVNGDSPNSVEVVDDKTGKVRHYFVAPKSPGKVILRD